MFNRYGPGETFGAHVDNAIRLDHGSGEQIRTDLSATLFLVDPEDYDSDDPVVLRLTSLYHNLVRQWAL